MKVTISGFYDEYSGKLDEQIAVLKQLNETYMCPRTLDGKNIADYTAAEFIRDIKPRLDAAGIKFSSIGSPIGKVNVNDEVGYASQLKKLKELVEIARAMDCKYIRIFSFFITKGEDPAKYRDVVLHKMKGFLKEVEGTGIILLHENEKHIYGDTDERCLDLYKTLNHPQFKLIYDASNFIQCGVDPMKAFELLKDYVVYYHIKDCDKETKMEFPVGLGDGKYEELFHKLNKRGYEGFMTMEPHTMKYALMRRPLFFVPVSALFASNYYKGCRKLDKILGKKITDSVTRKDVFLMQYHNLKKLLAEVK